jgi:hypothetical protein
MCSGGRDAGLIHIHDRSDMRHNALAITLVSCLFPVAAWAAPVPAPCSLVDHDTLAALALGDAVTKIDHKTVPATAQAPAQQIAMCRFTPRVGAGASLSVMVTPLPARTTPAKAVCNDSAVKGVGMASCFGVVKDSMVSVSLVAPLATFAGLNATLRTRFERILEGAAAP